MPATTITAGDLRRALTNALAGAELGQLDDVLQATTVLPPDAVAGALLEGGRAARQISARRGAPTLRAEVDAVTLTALIAAAERAAESAGHEFTDEALDEDVHDAASERGTTVNNGGVEAQVRYLAEQLGVNHVRVLLQSLGVTIGGSASTTADAGRATNVIGYDRWEHFAATLTDRTRIEPDAAGVDVDRVPEPRRAEIVAAWRFGAFDQRADGADAWWTSVGGPWFDRLQEALIAHGYGLAA